ncbi:transglycosylase domain-containing protein [Quadrisphaera oryzae]|uniref:transglycosylase domain-containing protein n=1 Tax=Quadrisphaera TaxID=317661 RepID=UPI0016476D85|nr:transglycosylase domain-containing protein [Quadrisphaera sp. RL12-1S]MBC3760503.1 penicillin-binding protein [Quadrisphaera sp. RL12-1S]
MPARAPRPRPDDGDADGRSTRRSASFGRATKLLAGFLAASVGAGVLVAGLAAPAVIAAGQTSNNTVAAFNSLPASLDQPPLSQQTRILYSDGSLMATFYYENRILVPLDKVSPIMQKAMVDIEDSRFYEHGGVDPRGLARAFVQNSQGGDTQGASTLTQQWIKNVQVEEALSALPTNATAADRQKAFNGVTVRSGLDGYVRKLREMKLAIAAEKKFSKDQILENYLNIANFGGGQYGVEAASRHWFNKSAADLDLSQAALLAGIVQNPVGYDPVNRPQEAQTRRDTVLARMLQLGTISQADHDAAVATPLEKVLDVQQTPNGCEQAGSAGFFCDYVVKEFRDDDAFGGSKEDRLKQLYRGGLTITTTLDRGRQDAAFQEVAAGVPADSTVPTNHLDGTGKVVRDQGTSNLGASIVSVEPGTGKIIAMAQNRTYNTSPDAPAGATAINYNTDYTEGGSAGFQPGSNFKPFVLATWLASGRTLNATVNGTQRAYPNGSWKYGSCYSGSGYGGEPYAPGNAGDGEESGTMPVLEATAKSINTGYAAMENQLNLCDVGATAQALGMHKAKADTRNITGKTSTDINVTPAMMLGVDEVAPLSVATAYAAFAAEGNYCVPTAIAKVTDADGKGLPVPAAKCNQAISKDVANGVNYALQRVLQSGGTASGNGLAGGREAAGKTGTTDKSVATWFTGYTPQLATAVWIGVPERSMSLNGATIAGRRYPTMYGATVSAPIWQKYMNRALDGVDQQDFNDPPYSIIGSPPAPPRPAYTPGPSGGGQNAAPSPGGQQGGGQGGQPGGGQGGQGGQPGGGDQGGQQGGGGGGGGGQQGGGDQGGQQGGGGGGGQGGGGGGGQG